MLNGYEQILAGSIAWSNMATGAIVPLASIVSGSNIILSTGAVAMGAALNMGSYTIQSLGTPSNSSDAATKLYVDDKTAGVGGIFFAQTVSTTNVSSLTGATPTIDGYAMSSGQIVLLTAQTTASQNGPWIVQATWARPVWWATTTVVSPGSYFYVDNYGTSYHDTKWWMTTIGTITVDTTSIAFSQDLSGTTYTAGAGGGLTLAGGAFSVNTGNGITLSSGNVTAVGTGIISVGASGIAVVNSTAPGQVVLGNASDVATWTTVSGDATLNSTGTLTLANVNSNTGAWGGSTAIPTFTVNGKGLLTAASSVAVIAPAGTLTGTTLSSSVVSSSLTGLGVIASGTWNGTAIGVAYGGTGQTTALTAFNALSPMTTVGDTLYGGTSGSATRLAAGSNTQVLIGGSTPSWGAVAISTMVSGLGAGVATALAAAPNGTTGVVTYSGQLGTPTQGILSACSGLAISTGVSGLGTGVATILAAVPTGSGSMVAATGPTISGATLSGTATISNAPIITALTGFLYANASSAITASTTIPSTALNRSTNETPGGSLPGTGPFGLAHTPVNSSLEFYLNGQLLRPGASYDYTVSGYNVTLTFTALGTDYLAANYFY
jgi:hypothetical protein